MHLHVSSKRMQWNVKEEENEKEGSSKEGVESKQAWSLCGQLAVINYFLIRRQGSRWKTKP